MASIELLATMGFGLEAVVARELQQLGYAPETAHDGRLTFQGDATAICRTNLWLRSADRILVKIGSFTAHDFGELFDQTNALPWADWLPVDAEFPVRGKTVRSRLHSLPNCQSIVKKAIVERLKQAYKRSWFEETGPLYAVDVSILKDEVTLTLDTTGPSLHKRGYRTLSGRAPLKETLAAGLLQLSYWNADRPLIDPFCGTGTIVIEAALLGRNIAPGLGRSFTAEDWHQIGRDAWQAAREAAREAGSGDLVHTLIGTDVDEKALSLARYHARQAGVEQNIHFQQKEFSELTTKRKYGCLVCNPPYGERLGERSAAAAVCRQMPAVFDRLDSWSHYVLNSLPDFEKLIGRRADRRRKLYNGRIACTYYQFPGPKPPD